MATSNVISVPRMLLLGSQGRNSGKTVLACEIIKRLKSDYPVIGLKVSTIHSSDRKCLRGGEGCGVCTSLKENYCLTVEEDGSSGKDTARMVAAGAEKVYWLRVKNGFLREGLSFFLEQANDSAPIVCESNSLRSVVEPGLFVMMKQKGAGVAKSSALAVIDETDLEIIFDGRDFDYDSRNIIFHNNVFSGKLPATLALLAGGGSKRMGQPKSLLLYRGIPLLEYIQRELSPLFSEVFISANEVPQVDIGAATVLSDRKPGLGPIGGIQTVLEEARYERVFITACDIPTIDHGLITSLLRKSRNHDVVVPRADKGYLEPLHAVYTRGIRGYVNELIVSGEKRIRLVYDMVDTLYYDLEAGRKLANINTPEEYRRASELTGGR